MTHYPDTPFRRLMFHIEPAQPADWMTAFEILLSHVPAGERAARVDHCLNLLENGMLHPDAIWLAVEGNVPVAAHVCVPLQGAACLFWLPGGAAECADALVNTGLAWCRSVGCKLAQALARPDEIDRAAPLLRCGFRAITRLGQWERVLTDLPARTATTLQFVPYRPERTREFAAVLERTYVGTQDCPELNGVRTTEEILAGHRAQGTFHPDFWWLVLDGARAVGVVFLVEMPDRATWELAYLGIVPEERGRGLARACLLHALHELAARGAARILLAVDERNAPARRLYQSLGFIEVETSQVFLYPF